MKREGINRLGDRLRQKIEASGHAPALDRHLAAFRAREAARRDQQSHQPLTIGRGVNR